MSSNNIDKDTHNNNNNYQTMDNYNNINNSNLYPPMKNIPTRGRANSSNSIDNSQINNNRLLKSNKHVSPAVSAVSLSSTYTSPVTRQYHQRNHSRTDSVNSNNSNNSNDSKKFLNSKNVVNKKDKSRASPILHPSSSSQFQNKKSNSYKPIRATVSSDNNSVNSYNYRPTYKSLFSKSNNSMNSSQAENDVTSQLSNTQSTSTFSSIKPKESNKSIDNSSYSNIDSINPKIKVNDNTLKNTHKYSNNGMKRAINSKMSISSAKDRSSIPGIASSDIGSYYASKNGITSIRPKSSVSYQYDSSNRTLTNGLNSNSALNSHAPSVNIYNPANYLSANGQYSDVRRKYGSCYSISSNSTILAPPKKYLNHNYSVYSYPKVKQMVYVVFIMLIICFVSIYASYSTKWIIVDTRLKTNNTVSNDDVIIHYEFGVKDYCYYQVKSNQRDISDVELECSPIKTTCPIFCISDVACVSFNPDDDGKDFEDQLIGEDSKDPEYSFCDLTSTSNAISKLYVLLNLINMGIGMSILYFLVKYREYKKGSLKESLRKRISIISEHYSFNTGDKRKSKLKDSNNNTPLNSNNNSSNFLNIKEDVESTSFHPLQFAEPESYDDSISNISVNANYNNNNNNNK